MMKKTSEYLRDKIDDSRDSLSLIEAAADSLAYQNYENYSPYSYNFVEEPFVTLFDGEEGTCSLTSTYQRQYVGENECVTSSAKGSNGEDTYSFTVHCASTDQFSTWSTLIFDSDNCNGAPITRVIGNGPCDCLPFDAQGEPFQIKVNCGGIAFYPCDSYFDDSYYYGAASSISVYAQVFDNPQCLQASTAMKAAVGHNNRTIVSSNGLNVQNAHCVTGIFSNNSSLGFVIDCKEPVTTSKWTVDVYDNCTEQGVSIQPLNTIKGYNPCDCGSGETNGISYSISVNCAGSTTYTCSSPSQASFLNAEQVAGIVVGSVAAFVLLLAVVYPLFISLIIPKDDQLATEDEIRKFNSNGNSISQQTQIQLPKMRESENTVVVNPINSTNKTISSMDMISSLYDQSVQNDPQRNEDLV
jgi:hypothetical protein